MNASQERFTNRTIPQTDWNDGRMSPRKILFVIPTLDQSGAEKQLATLVTRLPRDEFEPSVITLTRGGYYERMLRDHDIPHENLGKRFKFDPQAMRRLRKRIREQEPDIIHAWLFAANSYVRLVAPKDMKSRIVISERCVDQWKARWQKLLDRRLRSRTDALVGNSPAVVQFYEGLGYRPEQLHYIPNGLAMPERTDRSAIRERMIRELDLPRDARLIMYVGRLAKQKRVEDILWAMQVLRQIEPRARLLLIGDGPERELLIPLAKSLEVDEYVRFVGHRRDAHQLLAAADLFWLASEFEGLSNSVMEAMSHGVVPLVTRIDANAALVEDDHNGYLFQIGDSIALANLSMRLLQNEEQRREMGQRARERMAEDFSVEQMVRQYVKLYRRLLETPVENAAPAVLAGST